MTADAGGCTGATTLRIHRDWRIAYLCSGVAYFTMLRTNQRFHVQTDGGDTTRLVPQTDTHFVLTATTANLLGSGTMPEHHVYMVNLFKRPPERVDLKPGQAFVFHAAYGTASPSVSRARFSF